MPRTSLKNDRRCPLCDGTEVLSIPAVRQHGEFQDDARTNVLPVVKLKRRFGVDGVGSFTLYVCGACGFTEWFANDLERLKELATTSSEKAAVIGGLRMLPPPADD